MGIDNNCKVQFVIIDMATCAFVRRGSLMKTLRVTRTCPALPDLYRHLDTIRATAKNNL